MPETKPKKDKVQETAQAGMGAAKAAQAADPRSDEFGEGSPERAAGGRPKPKKGMLKRLFRMLFEFYPVLLPVVLFCIVFSAIVSSMPSVFMQNVIAVIEDSWKTGDWVGAKPQIIKWVSILGGFYFLSIISVLVYNQLMAVITQGFLKHMRIRMFDGMQNLPVKYFDTHNHGDIMSYYTNDIDTLRQVV